MVEVVCTFMLEKVAPNNGSFTMNNNKTLHTRRTIGLPLIGGMHHIFHLIPIAVELEGDSATDVIVYVRSKEEEQFCEDVLAALGATKTRVVLLKSKFFLKFLSPKSRVLLSNLKIWNQLDAIIVVERTSTKLRRFSKRLPPFIHIPHGAGDRAKGYDPRIQHFDHVLVAGEKDKKRMLDLGIVTEDTCHVTGYIKPYAVKRIYPETPILFSNSLPVVLYNPHFDLELSSWVEYGANILETFAQNPEMNFIFAPHIRLFENHKEAELAEIKAFSKYDNIHVDLGSQSSCDMTYTRGADIYLGDASSQVYEFLTEPKPCVFLTNSGTDWKDNPDFAHWRYGPVCHSIEDVMSALKRASKDHPNYLQAQLAGCLAAKGDPSWNPIHKAAQMVKLILDES